MLLADRYRLDMPLGRGGTSEVWTALDERLNRQVAVKLLAKPAAGDTPSTARFHRRARVTARLDHPHIVTVYDFGVSDDHLFLTMELVNGSSLAHELRRRGRLGPARVATAAAQTARGLAEAHRQGVVHGDVKPSNLLLDEEGAVKIAGFGVADRPDPSATTTGPPPGSTAEPGAPGDVYALGGTLYELLTGDPPGAAPCWHTDPLAAAACRRCPNLPDAYRDILLRMLATAPEERPEAAEVADWFTRAAARSAGSAAAPGTAGPAPARPAATPPTQALPATPVTRTAAPATAADGPPRRRRWPAVTGAVTAAAALTAGVVALTTPANSGTSGSGTPPRPALSEPAAPAPPPARDAGARTAGTHPGVRKGRSAPPSHGPAGTLPHPGTARSASPGPPTPAGPSRPPTTAPTPTPPPTTAPPSPTASPSTTPSTHPSPTPSGPGPD